MITNKTCPYCQCLLIKAENKPNSRSVEHLIPNAVLTRKRKNNEGDFYACRRCNTRKSNIDYVLGVVTRSQSIDNDLAANTLINAVTKDEKRSKRFIDMVLNAQEGSDVVTMEVPIRAEELLEYIHFLGKGQYFKSNTSVFNPERYVMDIQYINKQVLSALENSYINQHGTNPFRDLERNAGSEIVNDGECIIWEKNNKYLFIFHDYTVIIIKVLKRTKKNIKKAIASETYILKHFDYAT